MSVITISRGSFSKGKEIAEKAAEKLGYDCVSRSVLLEASEHFNIPELKLEHALHDAPSLLERFTKGKERYVSYMRASLLHRLKEDNVVYHGLAGHYFVKHVPHVMKVRIIADLDDRIAQEMERAKIGREEAEARITQDDKQRRKWSMHLYDIDNNDPHLYDLVIHVHKLSVDDAVELICTAVRKECFATTERSRQMMEDLSIEAEVQAILLETGTDLEASVSDSIVHLATGVGGPKERSVPEEVVDRIKEVEGVKGVDMSGMPPDYTNPWHNV